MFVLALCLFVMRAVIAVTYGVTEEENAEEFGDQYREPEPKNEYHEQELPEGFEDNKFNLIFSRIFRPSFINTTYWPILQNCICFDC